MFNSAIESKTKPKMKEHNMLRSSLGFACACSLPMKLKTLLRSVSLNLLYPDAWALLLSFALDGSVRSIGSSMTVPS